MHQLKDLVLWFWKFQLALGWRWRNVVWAGILSTLYLAIWWLPGQPPESLQGGQYRNHDHGPWHPSR
jgi:hypothetical protein